MSTENSTNPSNNDDADVTQEEASAKSEVSDEIEIETIDEGSEEIEEEEKNPISDECKLLLEDYANSIASYSAVLKKIEANQDNINLIIARSAQEEEMYAYSSFPEMFSCLQNPAFQKQIEILNDKRDKLISQ